MQLVESQARFLLFFENRYKATAQRLGCYFYQVVFFTFSNQ